MTILVLVSVPSRRAPPAGVPRRSRRGAAVTAIRAVHDDETDRRHLATSLAVRARSGEMGQWKTQSIRRKVAERMDLDEEELRVRVVMSTYGALMRLAMDQWQPDCQPGDREAMLGCVKAIESTYATFRETVPGDVGRPLEPGCALSGHWIT